MSITLTEEQLREIDEETDDSIERMVAARRQTMISGAAFNESSSISGRDIDKENDEYIKKTVTAALESASTTLDWWGTILDDQIRKLAPILKKFIREHLIKHISANPFLKLSGEIIDVGLDFLFPFIRTFIGLVSKALTSPIFWDATIQILKKIWEDYEDKGKLAQIYNCGKGLAMSILHAVKVILNKVLSDRKLNLTPENQEIINAALAKEFGWMNPE